MARKESNQTKTNNSSLLFFVYSGSPSGSVSLSTDVLLFVFIFYVSVNIPRNVGTISCLYESKTSTEHVIKCLSARGHNTVPHVGLKLATFDLL